MRLSSVNLFILLATVLWCATAVLTSATYAGVMAFHHDFNLDEVDGQPSADPPGLPAADHLRVYYSGGPKTVRAAVGDLLDQPLEIVQRAGEAGGGMIAYLDPEYTECGSYVVRWRSLSRKASTFFMSCEVRGQSGSMIATISYRGSKLVYNAALGRDIDLPFGFAADQAQLFEVRVDRSNRTTSLSVDGVPVSEVQDVAFVQLAPNLEMISFSFGGLYAQTMAVDDIEVVASQCSGVAVENESWGTVKAWFDER